MEKLKIDHDQNLHKIFIFDDGTTFAYHFNTKMGMRHWLYNDTLRYVGICKKEDLKRSYPNVSILRHNDPKISKEMKGRLQNAKENLKHTA